MKVSISNFEGKKKKNIWLTLGLGLQCYPTCKIIFLINYRESYINCLHKLSIIRSHRICELEVTFKILGFFLPQWTGKLKHERPVFLFFGCIIGLVGS